MLLADPIRAAVARDLERGARPTPLRRALAGIWGALSTAAACRPLELPAGVPIVGVGGAVLGGAGKTPVAVAIARELARRGARPALVGHAFRATPARARVVAVDDAAACVGDDALSAARLLAADGVPVVVAPTRQAAVDMAARTADVLVVDGLLQTRPARLADAVLVLDASAPWGSGAFPPVGDLRAPPAALLEAADHVASIGAEPGALCDALARLNAVPVPARIAGTVDATGRRAPLAALAGARLGLVLAIARPDRVVLALASAGIVPAVRIFLADHAAIGTRTTARLAGADVDVWVTTARCATKLPAGFGRAPVLALDHRVDVGRLVDSLGRDRTELRPCEARFFSC